MSTIKSVLAGAMKDTLVNTSIDGYRVSLVGQLCLKYGINGEKTKELFKCLLEFQDMITRDVIRKFEDERYALVCEFNIYMAVPESLTKYYANVVATGLTRDDAQIEAERQTNEAHASEYAHTS